MSDKTNFLEADNSILEQNLRFVRNDVEENLNKFFGGGATAGGINQEQLAPERDYKVVQPKPGFCIKSYKVNSDEKYFINVCQTVDIPAPEDLSEMELTRILNSDQPSSFRIPMSISEPRTTKDKSEHPVDACDIAINPKFFEKCERSKLFRDFFLALIGEALSEKYNVQIRIDKTIILSNRKFIGTLVTHRVRNKDVKTVLKSYRNPTAGDKDMLRPLDGNSRSPLVQEIDAKTVQMMKEKTELVKQNSNSIKKAISQAGSTEPEFKLRAKLADELVEELLAEFHLPNCVSGHEIKLDIGEDRILLESFKHGYLFDKFVNYRLNSDRARATFDKTNKILQVRIPVYAFI